MPAYPWELRADVRPLEAAAQRWDEVSARVSRRGDELVEAARRATEGWDAASAEGYGEHRKQVLDHLDRFTSLADLIADCLRGAATVMSSSQEELDRAWTTVAAVPHEIVGESRHLVFTPSEDDERGRVVRGRAEADDIRGRLAVALDQESARLRAARAELVTVRTELLSLTGGSFPGFGEPGSEVSGVGTVAPASTSVPGAAQAGVSAVSALPPPVPVSVPGPIGLSAAELTGLSAAGLTSLSAAEAGGLRGRRGGASGRQTPTGTPPVGGTGAMGMAARAGTSSRGVTGARSGPARMQSPRPERTAPGDLAAREKEAAREAKRAALEEKRAGRAARKAERQAARSAQSTARVGDAGRGDDQAVDEAVDEDDLAPRDGLDGPDPSPDGDAAGLPDGGERRPVVRVVHEATPGRPVGDDRR